MSIDRELSGCWRNNAPAVSTRLPTLLLIAAGLVSNGCGGPSETTRDNRRLLDAILTAVTIRDGKELSKDRQLLDTRRETGKLSKNSFSVLDEAVTQAESGNWTSAEVRLYDFRKRMPFPK